jgi:hypothetical protein
VNASPSRAAAEAHPLVALLNRYGNSHGDAQPVSVQFSDIRDAQPEHAHLGLSDADQKARNRE